MNLVGKTALVTGASRGIGGGICPGRVLTDMAVGLSDSGKLDRSEWLQVEDIVHSALFLLSLPASIIVREIFIHPRFQTVKK